MKKILVTGCAGFIGFHVSLKLLRSGDHVVGFDKLTPFYDDGLKTVRLNLLREHRGFEFLQDNLADADAIKKAFQNHRFEVVIHLAAQAGVRFSLENPDLYVQSNLVGFVNLIEEARKFEVPHFVFASSSSVYGANKKTPFAEADNVDHPISLYAATKKANELIAHVYAHLYSLPLTGLRFFTVYGPWGRPDMAMFRFCKAIFEDKPIQVYNYGNMQRDFTYVDDVVEGILRVVENPPTALNSADQFDNASPPYRLYNIGNNQPVKLGRLIEVLENKIGKKAKIEWLPMQPGDVLVTYAAIDKLSSAVGFRPRTPIEEGVSRFVDWYREFYKL